MGPLTFKDINLTLYQTADFTNASSSTIAYIFTAEKNKSFS